MSSASTPFSALKRAFLAFFKHDLVLHRSDDGVRLALENRSQPQVPPPPSRAKVAAEREQRDLELARSELAALLDSNVGLRSTLRHLAFVEHALEKKGWRSLYKVPPDVLQSALRQFEGLVTNWSPAGLACLRSKMAVAVIDREHQDPDQEADAYKTAAVLDGPPALAAQAIRNAKASSTVAARLPVAEVEAEGEVPDSDGDEDAAALLAAYAGLGVGARAAKSAPQR